MLYRLLRGDYAGYLPELDVVLPINSVAQKSHQPVAKHIIVTVEKTGDNSKPLQVPWYERLVPGSFAP